MNYKILLAVVGVASAAAFTAFKPIESVDAAYSNLTGYTFATVATNWSRTTNNVTNGNDFSLIVDFEDDSVVYNTVDSTFITSAFRNNFSGFDVALINTSGTLASTSYQFSVNLLFSSDGSGNFLNVQTKLTTTGAWIDHKIYYTALNQYHTMVFSLNFLGYMLTGTPGFQFRWGTYSFTESITSSGWGYDDEITYTSHNVGFRMLRNSSTISVATWQTSGELTSFRYDNFASVAESYYSDLANWYYQKGQQDADSTTLIKLASATIGILVNFVFVFLSLDILGISLLNVFGVLLLMVSIVWFFKIIRGGS